MYLKRIQIENYGAIKKLNIDLPLNENNNPKPLILVGKNGTGKTLITSSIIDSLIEIKRKNYQSIKEASGNSYYKAGKKDYIKTNENYSLVRISYTNEDSKISIYNDIASHSPQITREILAQYKINFPTDFNKHGFAKTLNGDINDAFDKNVILYFPVNRYYNPAWLVEHNDIRMKMFETYVGYNHENIIKTNVINEIESWILDVILDSELYEKTLYRSQLYTYQDGYYKPVKGSLLVGNNGKNTTIQQLINKILTIILRAKIPNLKHARFGISSKENGRKISVLISENGMEDEHIICPTFSHMSSGEAMLVALFCSIIKTYDAISLNDKNFDTSNINGIVVIDEIDLNLHIGYTKQAVPQLLQLFPKIQFIITSHSPFLLLGMKETFGKNYQLVNMPNGDVIDESDFDEVNKAYSIFIDKFESVKNNLMILESEKYQTTRTMIVTEGKTDWKHIKNALHKYQMKGEFSDLDVIFHEYEDTSFSDDKLNSFLTNVSQVKNNKKIIGIFDRDEGNGKRYSKEKFTHLGNNVYAISIPQPEHRSYHDGICIEFMYQDGDLFREDEFRRRLYVSSEFNDNGRLIENFTIGVKNQNKIKGKNVKSRDNIIDSEVIDVEGNSLAMSKSDFANYIYSQHSAFDDVDVASFKPLFDMISEINNENLK
ncbi:AAA family ATPase [Aeromonas media]|uniref:AAA family ATPase n=1 Tax=Aeromonas media TaxID=651 RepID=UPI00228310C0|nr:AAA family ATPase [Aeromonas media]MCY9835456.1 AAA family ATPase [Aeromonas media]